MKTEKPSDLSKLRKPYVKPQIEKVHLRTNETMGFGCHSVSVNTNDTDGTCTKGANEGFCTLPI